jgi:hypothetical protein
MVVGGPVPGRLCGELASRRRWATATKSLCSTASKAVTADSAARRPAVRGRSLVLVDQLLHRQQRHLERRARPLFEERKSLMASLEPSLTTHRGFGTTLIVGTNSMSFRTTLGSQRISRRVGRWTRHFTPWTVKHREDDKAGKADHIEQNFQPRRHGNLPNNK